MFKKSSIQYKCPNCSASGRITYEPFEYCDITMSELYTVMCDRCGKTLFIQHKNGASMSWLKEEQKIKEDISIPLRSEIYLFFIHIPITSNIDSVVEAVLKKVETLDDSEKLMCMSEYIYSVTPFKDDYKTITLPENTFFVNSSLRAPAPFVEKILLSLNTRYIIKKAFSTFYTFDKTYKVLDFTEEEYTIREDFKIGVKS